MKRIIRRIVWLAAPKGIKNHYDLLCRVKATHVAECPICGVKGYFKNFGNPPRLNALCPNCNSLERHRLFYLFFLLNHNPNDEYIRPKILHFAAEPILELILRPIFGSAYQTADLTVPADLTIDIEKIELDSNTYSTIICMHVLEHVDDTKALSEMFRIMKKNSHLILAFPIIEGWDSTYENHNIDSDKERLIHFGQVDHIKYYGRDVRKKIESHGFEIIEEFTGSPEMCILYNLQRGERIFVCKKS